MRLIKDIAVIILTAFQLFGNDVVAQEKKEADSVYGICKDPDTQATFPGGMGKLMSYMAENLVYSGNDDSLPSKIYYRITIEADGTVSNVEILKGKFKGFDETARKVLENMPKWVPATCGNENVRSYYTIPLQICLQ